jgi:hypothetical protein
MKYDRVFFCQAYNDISYILASIELEKYEENLIIVVDNYGLFQFLESLDIKHTQFNFISRKLKSLRNPFQIISERINIWRIRKNILANINDVKVTVYATVIDLLTCSCIEPLRKNNDVYLGIPLLESDNFSECKTTSLKVKFLSKIYSTKLHSYQHVLNKTAGLPKKYVDKYLKTDYILDKSRILKVQKKYSKNLSKDPFILLLDTEVKTTFNLYKQSHTLKMTKVFDYLQDFDVFLKGHPRRGASILALEYNFKIIDNEIPIEYIDLSNCVCVIGSISNSLANIADHGVKSISLLKYLDFNDNNLKNGYIRGLSDRDIGECRVLFPETFDSFKILLNRYTFAQNI